MVCTEVETRHAVSLRKRVAINLCALGIDSSYLIGLPLRVWVDNHRCGY